MQVISILQCSNDVNFSFDCCLTIDPPSYCCALGGSQCNSYIENASRLNIFLMYVVLCLLAVLEVMNVKIQQLQHGHQTSQMGTTKA